jgi:ABC-type transport system involved in multi-copper enzyme maturation permease subunit
MSTATAPAALTPRRFDRPGLGLLTRVELRKAVDTRAGRWLLAITALGALAVSIARGLTGAVDDRTFSGALELGLLPLSFLLPVIGILLVTSEWSQRTALATFALVPHRERVAGAKVLAALSLGLLATIAGIAAAAIGNGVGIAAGDANGSWSLSGAELAQSVLGLEANILIGVAFGLLLMSPAVAIVAYFALPTVFSILGEVIGSLESTFGWIDPNRALDPLYTGDAAGGDWGRIAVCLALWIGVPLAVGAWRLLRREVK